MVICGVVGVTNAEIERIAIDDNRRFGLPYRLGPERLPGLWVYLADLIGIPIFLGDEIHAGRWWRRRWLGRRDGGNGFGGHSGVVWTGALAVPGQGEDGGHAANQNRQQQHSSGGAESSPPGAALREDIEQRFHISFLCG